MPPYDTATVGKYVSLVERLAVPGSAGPPIGGTVAPGVGSVQSAPTLTAPAPSLTDGPWMRASAAGSANAAAASLWAATPDAQTPRSRGWLLGSA